MALFSPEQIEKLRQAEALIREVYLEAREVCPPKLPNVRMGEQSEEVQDMFRLTMIASMLGKLACLEERVNLYSGTIFHHKKG